MQMRPNQSAALADILINSSRPPDVRGANADGGHHQHIISSALPQTIEADGLYIVGGLQRHKIMGEFCTSRKEPNKMRESVLSFPTHT